MFKERLKSESTVELERLRHSLRLIASEYEKQVHLLHESRAEVIAELYARLKALLGAASSFASLVEWKGERAKEEKAAILADKAYKFIITLIRSESSLATMFSPKSTQYFKKFILHP